MHKVVAWTASNLRYSPFEWSASLPRIFVIRNIHVWKNVARHIRDGGFPLMNYLGWVKLKYLTLYHHWIN
jgi:hypothetical protein